MISIMLYALINSRAEAKTRASRPFFPFGSRFYFRYVFTGLVIIVLTTLSTSPLPTAPYHNMQMLKNLESYELKTTGNPFLLQIRAMDPSLGIAHRIEDNPCVYEIGDIAVTRISINNDSQITRYFCSEDEEDPYETIELFF